MLVRGVVDHQFGDHPHPQAMGLVHQLAEVRHGAEGRMDGLIVGDVVAIVAHGRWIERQKPQGVHAKFLQVAQLGDQPGEIAYTVAVAVKESLDMQFVDDGVLVPQVIRFGRTSRGNAR
jgi:hypothetical protein